MSHARKPGGSENIACDNKSRRDVDGRGLIPIIRALATVFLSFPGFMGRFRSRPRSWFGRNGCAYGFCNTFNGLKSPEKAPWHVSPASISRPRSASKSAFAISMESARTPRTRSFSQLGIDPIAPGQRSDRIRSHPDPRNHRPRLSGRRRSAPRSGDEHQAPDGSGLLSRPASPQGPAGPRSAHPHQRPHPQRPRQSDRRQEESHQVNG